MTRSRLSNIQFSDQAPFLVNFNADTVKITFPINLGHFGMWSFQPVTVFWAKVILLSWKHNLVQRINVELFSCHSIFFRKEVCVMEAQTFLSVFKKVSRATHIMRNVLTLYRQSIKTHVKCYCFVLLNVTWQCHRMDISMAKKRAFIRNLYAKQHIGSSWTETLYLGQILSKRWLRGVLRIQTT